MVGTILTAAFLFGAPPALPVVLPADAGLDAGKLAALDGLVAKALAEKKLPGCVALIARHGKIGFLKAFGDRQVLPTREAMTADTIFDLASLTKPIACSTSIMLLMERGRLRLEDKLSDALPGCASPATIEQALLHVAGYIPDNAIADYAQGPAAARTRLLALKPRTPPGSEFKYSDVGMQMLGEVVRAKTGKDIAAFTAEQVFGPLGLKDTAYNPPAAWRPRIAPTEKLGGEYLRGRVHDPRAAATEGIAGHAGLFSTAADLAVFAEMVHRRGEYGGVRILTPETVALWTKPRPATAKAMRAYGWDAKSGYSSNRGANMSAAAIGHGAVARPGAAFDGGFSVEPAAPRRQGERQPARRGHWRGRGGRLLAGAVTTACCGAEVQRL